MKADLGARVFYTTQGGYDTHATQQFTHANLLGEFAGAVNAFFDDLQDAKLADRVPLLAFSEFGRTIKENGSAGTDHGTAGRVFLAGPTVKAGVVGTHAEPDRPGQGRAEDDDRLPPGLRDDPGRLAGHQGRRPGGRGHGRWSGCSPDGGARYPTGVIHPRRSAMTTEVARIDDELHRAYDGAAWHGPSFREVLAGVTADVAARRHPAVTHSINTLVRHVSAWVDVARRRLAEWRPIDVPAADDFPPAAPSPAAWDATLAELDGRCGRCASWSPASTRPGWTRRCRARTTRYRSCCTGRPSTWPTTPGRSRSSRSSSGDYPIGIRVLL